MRGCLRAGNKFSTVMFGQRPSDHPTEFSVVENVTYGWKWGGIGNIEGPFQSVKFFKPINGHGHCLGKLCSIHHILWGKE